MWVLSKLSYGPFLGPYYNTGPSLGDPKRDHNFDDPPCRFWGVGFGGEWANEQEPGQLAASGKWPRLGSVGEVQVLSRTRLLRATAAGASPRARCAIKIVPKCYTNSAWLKELKSNYYTIIRKREYVLCTHAMIT